MLFILLILTSCTSSQRFTEDQLNAYYGISEGQSFSFIITFDEDSSTVVALIGDDESTFILTETDKLSIEHKLSELYGIPLLDLQEHITYTP